MRLTTEWSWVQNLHNMLPPLVSEGARAMAHGLEVKAMYTWSRPCSGTASYKQNKVIANYLLLINYYSAFQLHFSAYPQQVS